VIAYDSIWDNNVRGKGEREPMQPRRLYEEEEEEEEEARDLDSNVTNSGGHGF